MASLWYKVIFKCIFIHQLVSNFKKMKKVRTPLVRMLFYRMAEPALTFSLWVFDNFGKIYVSIEDFAVRRMYVDPDRLFHVRRTYPNILNKWVCLPTVKRGSSNGGESYEKYRNPALFDRKSGVTTGYPSLRLDAVNYGSYGPFSTLKNAFRSISFEKISVLESFFIHRYMIIKYRSFDLE